MKSQRGRGSSRNNNLLSGEQWKNGSIVLENNGNNRTIHGSKGAGRPIPKGRAAIYQKGAGQ